MHHHKLLMECSSNQMVHQNSTMLSSIGAMACGSSRIMNSNNIMDRAGQVPTFCSVLKRGPSAKLFRSCSVPSHSVLL